MTRGELTEAQWQRLKPLLPPEQTGKRGGQWRPHRTIIDGILWILRTGAPWRDLPDRYGPFQTCADRLSRWSKDGTWTRLLQALQGEEDAAENVVWEGCALDSTSIKAHPHAAGSRRDPVSASEEPEKGGTKASRQTTAKRLPLYRARRVPTRKRSAAVAGD